MSHSNHRTTASGVCRPLCKPLLAIAIALAAPLVSASAQNLYWAPENVTVSGQKIDVLLNFIFWLTLVVFVLTQIVYVYYLIRYRRKPGVKATYSHGNNFLEIVWTTIPVIIFLTLAIVSNRVWGDIHSDPPANAVKVIVSGYQFGWDMRYAGVDGQLGTVDVKMISTENKFGIDPADPASKDDFSSTELVIPVDTPVQIILNARDVIHSFYVPQFRLYQDAVPGRTITWVWFQCMKTGNFELACSQLCGKGHYNMKAPIRVVSKEEFEKWNREKSQAAVSSAVASVN